MTVITNIKPGDLCYDNGRLCVLVKIGDSNSAVWAKLMSQVAGMLQPYGYFLDLEEPEIRFGQLHHLGNNLDENSSGSDVATLFTRNLAVQDWIERKD